MRDFWDSFFAEIIAWALLASAFGSVCILLPIYLSDRSETEKYTVCVKQGFQYVDGNCIYPQKASNE